MVVCNNVLGLYSRQLGKSNTGDPEAYLLGWKNYMGFIGFLIHKIYSISLENFIECNPLISEECSVF